MKISFDKAYNFLNKKYKYAIFVNNQHFTLFILKSFQIILILMKYFFRKSRSYPMKSVQFSPIVKAFDFDFSLFFNFL